MTRFLGVLVLLSLVAIPLLAEPSDSAPGYALFVTSPDGRAGDPIPITLSVSCSARQTATAVTLIWTLPDLELVSIDERCVVERDRVYRCVVDELEPMTTDALRAVVIAPHRLDGGATTGRLVSASPAPGRQLLVDKEIAVVAGAADVTISTVMPEGVDPNGLATFRFTIEGRKPFADPKWVEARIWTTFMPFETFDAPPGWECGVREANLVCSLPAPAVGTKQTLIYRVRPTFPQGGATVRSSLTWQDGPFRVGGRAETSEFVLYYEFDVTSGNDSGAGSLRQAIAEANAICSHPWAPCRIRFAEGVTVRPESPLPVVDAQWIVIDGGRIDGSRLHAPANGLALASSLGSNVRGLTIENVPGNALMLQGGAHRIADSTFRNNAGRGIVTTSARYTIADNNIRGNGASGVFVLHGHGVIENNRIEDNGATGIFFDGYAISTVRRNRIGGNRQFGIALAGPLQVDVVANEIVANGNADIDIGLDGPSFAGLTDGLHAPILTAAHYDANTGTTVIDGVLDRPRFVCWLYYDVHFYAGGEYLGTLDDMRKRKFRFRAPGDLRGRAITANAIRETRDDFNMWETTEMSETIVVQP